LQQVRSSAERSLGTSLGSEQAQDQMLVEDVFAGNGLRQQNIPVYGSRVRIQGRNVPEGQTLSINGESYPVDMERKFVADYLMPIGQHRFDIAVSEGGAGAEASSYPLDV